MADTRRHLAPLIASANAVCRVALRCATALFDAVAPPRCAACSRVLDDEALRPGSAVWCPPCASGVVPLGRPFCLGCHTSWDAHDAACRAPLPLLAAVQYGEAVGALVRDAKYEGWEPLLDAWLSVWRLTVGADGVPDAPLPDLLCPVPTHPVRRRERGYAVPECWAARLASHLGRPLVPALRRARSTRPQVGLDRRSRSRNVRNAFAPGSGAGAVRGRRVALVDDVVTSGATVRESANLLRSLGARRVEVWSFAYEPIE